MEDVAQVIPEGMMAGYCQVLLTTHQMVAIGIQSLTACRAWWEASAYWQHQETKPEPAKASEIHIG